MRLCSTVLAFVGFGEVKHVLAAIEKLTTKGLFEFPPKPKVQRNAKALLHPTSDLGGENPTCESP